MRVQSGPHRGTNNGGPTGLGGPGLTQCTCLLAEFLQRGPRKGPAQLHTAGPHGPTCTGRTRKVQRPCGQTGRQSQGCRAGRATAAPGLTCWDHWNQPDVPSAVCGQQDRQSLTPTGSQNPGPPGSRVWAGRGEGGGRRQVRKMGSSGWSLRQLGRRLGTEDSARRPGEKTPGGPRGEGSCRAVGGNSGCRAPARPSPHCPSRPGRP